MTKIDHKNCLPDASVSIRGVCEDAKLYIDDLAGINVVNAADATEYPDGRPEVLVTKSFKRAKQIVLSDLINLINQDFVMNKVMDESRYDNMGSDIWYGEVNEYLGFKIERNTYNQKVLTGFNGFTFLSDRDAGTVDFIINCGGEETVHSQGVVKGINRIDIEVDSITDVRVYFSVLLFKVGRRTNYHYIHHQHRSCTPCANPDGNCHFTDLIKSEDGIAFESFIYGINLMTRCEYDTCRWLIDYFGSLSEPLLIQSGIQFLMNVKASNRINAYTRNSMEKIEYLLLQWKGGQDTVTGLAYKSDYWRAITSAYSGIKRAILSDNADVFQINKSTVYNSLP